MNGLTVTRSRTIVLFVLGLLICGLSLGLLPGAAFGASSPAASPSGSAAPSDGKVIYKVGILAEPDNLNPFIGYLWSSFEMWYLAYDPLVGYDYGELKPMKGEDSPGLATDWAVSADGKTWDFTIRSGVKWQDGVPLTASDVAFTYNYIIENNLTNFSSYTELITKAVAVDDTHVRFICSKPKASMLNFWVPIVPEHIWSKIPGKDAANKYQNKPPFVGSGPFKCVEWKKSSYVKLVANPDYWRGRPTIDEIYFEYYTNADTMVQDLKAGTIDGVTGILDAQYRQLKNVPGIEARTIRTNGFDEIAFNCYAGGPSRGNPVLKDYKFRQALNYAIDKAKIAAVPYGGHAVPATTIITKDYYSDPDWHWEPAADQAYTFDPEIAKQKLDEAGYKDTNGDGVRDYHGKPITLRLVSRSESMISQAVGKLIASWLKDIGLKITLDTMEEGALTDMIYATKDGEFSPDYDMFLWGWYSDLDPGPILSYFTKAQINAWSDCAWTDPEYEKLYTQQTSEIDPQKRKALIDRMQQIVYEQSPYIPTVYSNDLEAYNVAKWEGYEASPAEVGNMLFPPYGNAGSQNFLNIRPKAAAEESEEGGSSTTWIIVAVLVVAIVITIVALLVRRKPESIEE